MKITLETINIIKEKPEIYTFDVEDLFNISNSLSMENDIKYITKLIVPKEHRNKGLGSKALVDLCKSIGEDTFILITAGALLEEYKEEPTVEEYEVILNRLDKFLIANGFIDVNEHIGCYENKCSYLYGNKVGLEIVKSLKKE